MSLKRPIEWPIKRPLPRAIGEAGGGGVTVYGLLASWQQPADTTAYLWKSYDATNVSHEMWARSDNAGHFTCAQFRAYPGSILTIGRLREGMIGTTIHHANGAVTKTGTWANSSNSAAFGGSASQSSTSGDTIACTVTGSTLGLRIAALTNGGYATVAIDGDYTAAVALPAVTQALIDAGKFTQGQLGHRYLNCYAAIASPDLWNFHALLAEGLTNAAHTITVRVQGTAASGSGNRAYVSAFVGCTGAQAPGDAGTAMFYVRDVSGAASDSLSSMTLAWEFAPTGQTKEDIGDNHGNETLVSSEFAVDGSPVTLSADQIVSGSLVTLTRVVTMTHTVTGTVGTKTDTFSCRGDRRYQVQYDWSVTWAAAGNLGFAYCGMLNHLVSYALTGDKFPVGIVGDAALTALAGDNSNDGLSRETVSGFLSPDHDTVATITVPDPVQSLNNWTYAGPSYAWLSDGTANRKCYFTRALGAGAPTLEPVTASQVMSGSCAWRVFRVADAYNRISAQFS